MIPSAYPVFTDLDGTPLEAGYIFIGSAGFNPETYPQTIYWDQLPLTIAANPVRTIGGYPSNNGAPGRIKVLTSSYSITVRNKNYELIYTSLNETDSDATYLKLATGGTVSNQIYLLNDPTVGNSVPRKSWIDANFLPLAGGTISGPISYATLPSVAAHLVNKQYADSLVFPGMFGMAAFSSSIPTGWLLCNGAAISRTTYATLFAAIGTVWGAGDGVSTFNIPDGRGEFFRGFDNGRGIDSGRVFGVSQAEMIGPHTHPGVPLLMADTDRGTNSSSYNIDSGSSSTGTNSGTENRPRNITVNLLIKY